MCIINITEYKSPVGKLIVGAYRGELCICDWASEVRQAVTRARIARFIDAKYVVESSAVVKCAVAELDEYFACKRKEFTVPIRLFGTDFQCKVWEELMKVSYNATVSYTDVAQRIGRPKAVRAVASAIGANPISIVVPCHRVIGSDGKLTGYAGGVDAKRWLLQLESNYNDCGLITPIGE